MGKLKTIGKLCVKLEEQEDAITRQDKVIQRLNDEIASMRDKVRDFKDIEDKTSCVKYYKKIAINAGSSMTDAELGAIVRDIVKERRGEQ